MELLAGTRNAAERSRLRARLIGLPRLAVQGLADFESAAEVYRAAVAIREHATVLHNDRDFDVLARHSRLRIERYRTLRAIHPSR